MQRMRTLALVFLAMPALPQFNTGRISGTVYDPNGAVVPRAQINIKHSGTGAKSMLTCDPAGNFSVLALPIGLYVVSAVAPGFETASSEPLMLDAGAAVNVVLNLAIGNTKEIVTVTGTAAAIQTSSSDIGNTVSARQVQDLPLNGRDVTAYIALAPGSVQTGPDFKQSMNGFETTFTGINLLLDGSDATRVEWNRTNANTGGQGSRITRASVDSIAEVNIMQGSYKSEYGRSLGAVVNMITKSGTNEFHGGLFEYFRNNRLNARSFFETGPQKQPFRLNQFGGNLGGPIVKNKLFFFTNYEGVRQRISNSSVRQTLSQQQRALIVPSFQLLAQELAPVPANGTPIAGSNGALVAYNSSTLDSLREDTASFKVDHQIAVADRWNLRYNRNMSTTLNTTGLNFGQHRRTPAQSHLVRLDETHTFSPSLLNEVGVAINYHFLDTQPGESRLPWLLCATACGELPGKLGGFIDGQTSWQVLESLTKTAGPHTFKFGADIRRVRGNRNQDSPTWELYLFLSPADLVNNRVFQYQHLGYPMTGLRSTNWNFYGQDDWKVSRRLTLNLGVRYEYNTVFTEVANRARNFDATTLALLPGSAPFYEPDRNNFAPRIGFAYDPLGKGKTSIRGGFGIYYLPSLNNLVLPLVQNAFPSSSVTVATVPTLSYPVPANVPLTTGVASYSALDRKLRDSYAQQWSLNIQHEVASHTIAEIGYVGNHGLKLPAGLTAGALNLNPVSPAGTRRLTTFGDINLRGDFLSCNYNALQAVFKRRGERFTFDLNYTWAHAIDNQPNVLLGFVDPTNLNRDRAHSDTDVRHSFNANVIYDVPGPHTSSAVVNRILGGWSLTTVLQARSGLPVNVSIPGVGLPMRPDVVPGAQIKSLNYHAPGSQINPAAFTPKQGAFGTAQRNIARGPNFGQWDFGTMKNFKVTERFRFQFRGEVFNLLNHPNFNTPGGSLCLSITAQGACVANPLFGVSTSTIGNVVSFGTGTSRQAQFALRFLF